jgi:hypothetical protein
MPHLDAYGRWVSDDGALYWDGLAWQPMPAITGFPTYYPATATAAGPSSVKGPVALGLGIASLVFWLLPILGLPVAIAALVVGGLALRTSGRKLGRWGQVLGAVGLVLSVLNFVWGAYLALHTGKGG